jgi:hypothetical protein
MDSLPHSSRAARAGTGSGDKRPFPAGGLPSLPLCRGGWRRVTRRRPVPSHDGQYGMPRSERSGKTCRQGMPDPTNIEHSHGRAAKGEGRDSLSGQRPRGKLSHTYPTPVSTHTGPVLEVEDRACSYVIGTAVLNPRPPEPHTCVPETRSDNSEQRRRSPSPEFVKNVRFRARIWQLCRLTGYEVPLNTGLFRRRANPPY